MGTAVPRLSRAGGMRVAVLALSAAMVGLSMFVFTSEEASRLLPWSMILLALLIGAMHAVSF